MHKKIIYLLFAISFLFLLASCKTLVGPFDQYAYTQTTSLKVDVLDLLQLGNEEYEPHLKDIILVQKNLMKAYEYAKGRPKNQIVASMWGLMNNPDGDLFGGFIKLWKSQGKVSKAYILDKSKQLSKSFDQIAEIESKKNKS